MKLAAPSPILTASLLAGAIIGLLGVLLFGVMHAVIIIPIWTRLLGGTPFSLAAGLAMGWAYHELQLSSRLPDGVLSGVTFGFLVWATLLPMTAFTVILRATGLHNRDAAWESIVELLLAFSAGSLAGRWVGGRWRPAVVLGIASLAVALAQAGPIPVMNSARTAWLFVGLAFIYLVCGLALAALVPAIFKRLHPPV